MAENQNSDSQGTAALPTAPTKRRRLQLINPEDQIEVKLHRCKDCDKSFFTGLELAKHKKSHKTENLFKCPFCEHETTEAEDLIVHIQIHNDYRSFHCDQCNYATTDAFKLTRHKRTHTDSCTENLFKCPFCEDETAEAEDLIVHIQIHNDYRSFHCDQCNYATTDAFKLTRHKRTHTDSCTENLFKCPFCEDETAEAEDLIIHIQIHNDYSSFYCDKCNYATTDAFKLTRHKRTHTGERPFLCSACQIMFTEKLTMEMHVLQKPLGLMSTASTKLTSTPILLPHLPQHHSKNNKSSLLENEWSPGPLEEEFAWQVVPAEQEAEVHFLISIWEEIDALSQYHVLPVQTKDGSIIGLQVTGLQEMEQVDAGTIHPQVILGKDV